MSLSELGSLRLSSPVSTTSFNLRKLTFFMFWKQQQAEEDEFCHSLLGGIWKAVVEFPYTKWFWKKAESIRDRIEEWLEL